MRLVRRASPAGITLAEQEGLLVIVSVRPPDNEGYVAITEAQISAVERWGSTSIISVVPAFAGKMQVDRAVQEAQAVRMRALGDRLRVNAMAVTVSGMAGTMLRLVFASIHLLNGTRNTEIYASVAEAVEHVRNLPDQHEHIRTNTGLTAEIEALVQAALLDTRAA
mgnify:CR=1 FL=1